MARELSVLWLANFVGTPQISTIWKIIKLANKILEFVGDCPEWINYNRNLEEYLQTLRRKMECLAGVQADVEIQLDNTELQSGKKRKREVEHWLGCVKKKSVDVQTVEDSINSVSYLPRFLFRAWLGSRIGEEIHQLTELQEQGRFPNGLLLDAPIRGGELLIEDVLVGQAVFQNVDLIWSHLMNPGTLKIAVQGPAGIGKSAIMVKVHNRLCSSSYPVYYVRVPQNFSTFNLQAAIASEMKINLPQTEGTEIRRAGLLSKVLKAIKDFVLILDGLSQFVALEDVGIPVGCNGGKLILTSQHPDVCRRMSCQETVVLQSLSREDSEKLFLGKLAADPPLSEEVKNVAKNIIQRCAGVPSSIIARAVDLRGVTDMIEWQTTLNEM